MNELSTKLQRSLRAILARKIAAADAALEERAVRTASYAKQITTQVDAVDLGAYKAAWRHKRVAPLQYDVFNDSPYAKHLEYGRPPGLSGPTPEEIEGWITRKIASGTFQADGGEDMTPDEIKGLSFVIARNIHERGYAPRNIARTAQASAERHARRDVKRAIRRIRGVK